MISSTPCLILVSCLLALGIHANTDEFDEKSATLKNDATHTGPFKVTKEQFFNVLNEPEIGLFLMFYAPWFEFLETIAVVLFILLMFFSVIELNRCGHCKRMISTWSMLAQKHNAKKKFLIAKVDCTTETELCSENDILGYPT